VNEAPVITSNGGGATAAQSIPENSTAVTTITTADPDANPQLTFSIAGGADAARFAINPTTGTLTFVAPPDFETPTDAGANNIYDVTVQVSDGSLVDQQAISVSVTDVNEAPTVGADLLVTSKGQSTVVAGKGTVTYSFTVKNIGTLDATGVKISLASVLPPGVTVKSVKAPRGTNFSGASGNGVWNIPKLKKQASVTLCVTLSVGAATAPGANVIQSTATATFANQGLINTSNDSTTQTTSVTTYADVAISKHVAPKSVQAGANIAYTMTVTNCGPTAAHNVSVVDLLPAGTTFISQVQTSGPSFTLSSTATQVTNSIATLPAKASASFTVLVQVNGELPQGQKLTNRVSVSSSSSDSNSRNNSSTVCTSVSESCASLNASPADPSKQDLVVTGSSKSDTILVEPASGGKVSVKLNGKSLGSFNPTRNIVVYGRAGDDCITISPELYKTAILFGGSGDDKLTAGAGNSVLSGGDGEDQLIAGAGRNILIGGKGENTLEGTQGENLLIGGYTTPDAHQAALDLLLAEWSRTDASYAMRVAHLRGTLPGGLNEIHTLSSATVVDNQHVDSLMGGLGEDWFFAHTAGDDADNISAIEPGELVDTI
jgi:uncharacterized repeat protein (TIGR01451 family)